MEVKADRSVMDKDQQRCSKEPLLSCFLVFCGGFNAVLSNSEKCDLLALFN